jgi:2-methylcitrate dehydratase
MPMTLAERLAAYAAELQFADLSPEVVREVKRRVMDALGCAYGAWHAEPPTIARRVASAISAGDGATLLGTHHRTSPDWAAFANGCLVRYLDFNDTYLSREPAHPSDNIPAALAVAEAFHRSGRELIAAVALAYEVQCRLCDAASLRARGWDHVTYGAFSTALAAARLAGLSKPQTVQAVGIAGVASAALRQARVGELSHWKGCAFAHAARQGVFAVLLAREGMTGPAPIFEGEMGFQKLVSGPFELAGPWDRAHVGGDASPPAMILQTAIKFWPAEYHGQSAIEAALRLRSGIGDWREIDSILVESHDAAVDIIGSGPAQWRPATRETADHSLPYLVAVALADGQVTAAQFAPARLADPELGALVQRIRVVRNPELSAAYPGAVGNIVSLRMRNGATHRQRIDYPHGSARHPLSDAEVRAKFTALAEPLLGGARCRAILDRLSGLESVADVADLLPHLALG